MGRIKYYIIGFILVAVVTIIVAISSKHTSSNGTTCTPSSESCSKWQNQSGVLKAYKPCIEGTLQDCTGNNSGCQDGEQCSDGCCVQCSGSETADPATHTCKDLTPKCIYYATPNPLGTRYNCRCKDPNTGGTKCKNFTATYVDNNGKEQPVPGNQDAINNLCGLDVLPTPTGWSNSTDEDGNQTELVRFCTDQNQFGNEKEYGDFTCPGNLLPDQKTYKCSTAGNTPCDPKNILDNGCNSAAPAYSCDPTKDPTFGNYWCEGKKGDTSCLIKNPDGYSFKGRHRCLKDKSGNWMESANCYPCCNADKGWIWDESKNQCSRLPLGYTAGYEKGSNDQVLVRMPPNHTDPGTLHSWCVDDYQVPRAGYINANNSKNNNNANAGWYLNCCCSGDNRTYGDGLIIPENAYYKSMGLEKWIKCATPGGCKENVGKSSNNPISMTDTSLTSAVEIDPDNVPVQTNGWDSWDKTVCHGYTPDECPPWCEVSSDKKTCEFPKNPDNTAAECALSKPVEFQIKSGYAGNSCTHPYCTYKGKKGTNDPNAVCAPCQLKDGCSGGCITTSNTGESGCWGCGELAYPCGMDNGTPPYYTTCANIAEQAICYSATIWGS